MPAIPNTVCVGRASAADTKRRLVPPPVPPDTFEVPAKKTDEALICGQRIRQTMESRGLTQAQLARDAGMTSSRLGNYLQGLREIGIREAVALARVLRVPAAYLLGVVDDLDRDVLMTTDDQKRGFLALLGQEKGVSVPPVRHLKRPRAI